MAVLFALGASVTWGFGDFLGPLKGRKLGTLRVLVYLQLSGLLAIAAIVAVRGRGPEGAAILFALPAACSGTLGLYSFYRGMAVGAMSIVAPIAGVSALIPVVVGLASGDRPSAAQGAGIGCALLGVGLASRDPDRAGGTRFAAGAGLALLAALGFGGYFPAMHAAGQADPWWASLAFRFTATMLVALAAVARRPPLRVSPLDGTVIAVAGVADMVGNLLYAAASSRGGLVSIVSVLASLYPVVTIVLARTVLGERVAPSQDAGILLTLAGVALISIG
jgi:drug/metabolite transporter (DMT)-like permease